MIKILLFYVLGTKSKGHQKVTEGHRKLPSVGSILVKNIMHFYVSGTKSEGHRGSHFLLHLAEIAWIYFGLESSGFQHLSTARGKLMKLPIRFMLAYTQIT